MQLVGRRFRGLIALALLGDHMDEDRTVFGVAHILQNRQKVIEIVAVDRADIIEAELLEQRAAGEKSPRQLLGPTRMFEDELAAFCAPGVSRFPAGGGRSCPTAAATVGRHAPTGGAIDMSLSLRITMSRESIAPALFIAS